MWAPKLDGQMQNGALRLSLNGEPGHPFVWDFSDALAGWTPFLTNTDWSGTSVTTQAMSAPQRFFRARTAL